MLRPLDFDFKLAGNIINFVLRYINNNDTIEGKARIPICFLHVMSHREQFLLPDVWFGNFHAFGTGKLSKSMEVCNAKIEKKSQKESYLSKR